MNPEPSAMARCAMLVCLGVDCLLVWTDSATPFVMRSGFFSLAVLVVTAFLAYISERLYSLNLIRQANTAMILAVSTGFVSATISVIGCLMMAKG